MGSDSGTGVTGRLPPAAGGDRDRRRFRRSPSPTSPRRLASNSTGIRSGSQDRDGWTARDAAAAWTTCSPWRAGNATEPRGASGCPWRTGTRTAVGQSPWIPPGLMWAVWARCTSSSAAPAGSPLRSLARRGLTAPSPPPRSAVHSVRRQASGVRRWLAYGQLRLGIDHAQTVRGASGSGNGLVSRTPYGIPQAPLRAERHAQPYVGGRPRPCRVWQSV